MAENRGKKFEGVIRECLEKVPQVSVDRLHDQTSGFKGSQNICDFIVYREPYEYYFECKSVHGNILPLRNITDTQWQGLLAKSRIDGVYAGVICWWVDRDKTYFIPIHVLQHYKDVGYKSVRYDNVDKFVDLVGKKKKVYWEYDMEVLLNEIPYRY